MASSDVKKGSKTVETSPMTEADHSEKERYLSEKLKYMEMELKDMGRKEAQHTEKLKYMEMELTDIGMKEAIHTEKLKYMEKDRNCMHDEVKHLKTELERSRSSLQTYSMENDILKQEHNRLQEKLSQMENALDNRRQKNERMKMEIIHLKERECVFQIEMARMEQKHEMSEMKMNEMERNFETRRELERALIQEEISKIRNQERMTEYNMELSRTLQMLLEDMRSRCELFEKQSQQETTERVRILGQFQEFANTSHLQQEAERLKLLALLAEKERQICELKGASENSLFSHGKPLNEGPEDSVHLQLADLYSCGICKGDFRKPKLLECGHTFCSSCLTEYAKTCTKADVVPCPLCRHETKLPKDGVSALMNNYHVISMTPKRPKCTCDCGEPEEFYCTVCEEATCLSCKKKNHESHNSEQLADAIERMKKELSDRLVQVEKQSDTIKRIQEPIEQELKLVIRKFEILQNSIYERWSAMYAAVCISRDLALKSLNDTRECVLAGINTALSRTRRTITRLSILQREIKLAVDSDRPADVIATKKSMPKQAFLKTMSEVSIEIEGSCRKVSSRPVYLNQFDNNMIQHFAHAAIGRVFKVESEMKSDMTVEKFFYCGENPPLEVFSLCHVDGKTPMLKVSCVDPQTKQTMCIEFTEDGHIIQKKNQSLCHFKRYAEGNWIAPRNEITDKDVSTFTKSHTANYSLKSSSTGTSTVKSVEISVEPTFSVKGKNDFSINLANVHRAFDVDDTRTHFVVLEENCADPSRKDTSRQVLLFKRPGGDPVATYKTPGPNCILADICFYKLGKEQFLLVADEAYDGIHILAIRDSSFVFLRFLGIAPSDHVSALLIGPCAMTVDICGRLWVGTRTGQIVALRPTNDTFALLDSDSGFLPLPSQSNDFVSLPLPSLPSSAQISPFTPSSDQCSTPPFIHHQRYYPAPPLMQPSYQQGLQVPHSYHSNLPSAYNPYQQQLQNPNYQMQQLQNPNYQGPQLYHPNYQMPQLQNPNYPGPQLQNPNPKLQLPDYQGPQRSIHSSSSEQEHLSVHASIEENEPLMQ